MQMILGSFYWKKKRKQRKRKKEKKRSCKKYIHRYMYKGGLFSMAGLMPVWSNNSNMTSRKQVHHTLNQVSMPV